MSATSTPTTDPTAIARWLIDQARESASSGLRGLEYHVAVLRDYQSSGGMRAHNIDCIIQAANEIKRHLLRAEALEEILPKP